MDPKGLWTFAFSTCGYLALQYYFERICRPRLVFEDNQNIKILVSKCKSLKSFLASPFLLADYHGHLHSILPAAVRSLYKKRLAYNRELLVVGDGGTVGLDWINPECLDKSGCVAATTATTAGAAADAGGGKPVVILVHGLCGSTESSYIIYAAKAYAAQGYEVVSFVSRGCGKLALSTPLTFTASNFTDLGSAIDHVSCTRAGRNLFCVGYSLGAGILLNYLGSCGHNCPLRGAVAISPSWNFLRDTSVFDWWSRGHLVDGLKRYLRTHRTYLETHPDCRMNVPGALNCASVREFDHHAVVPVHGFDNVDHYYLESSACRHAHNIHVPTLAVSADDDPLCNAEGCPAAEVVGSFGPGLVVARTRVGGHVAFADGLFVTTSSWQDKVAVDWCNACMQTES